jgi:hypothetical protein
MITKISESILRLIARNNNQMLALKIVKRIFKIDINYAVSVIWPNNISLLEQHLIEKSITFPASQIEDTLIDNEGNLLKRVSLYNEEYLVKVKNVLVDTETGIAFAREDNPVAILESSNILAIEVSDYLRPRKPREKKNGEWCVLASRSYAHWMLQDLPRFLRLLEIRPGLQVAVSRNTQSYVERFLQIKELKPSARQPVLYAENFLFLSAQYPIGIPSDRDLSTLREFQDSLDMTPYSTSEVSIGNKYKKIYVSRSRSNRSLPNEKQIEIVMRKLEFEVVYLESLPFDLQVYIFSQAELICGSHGAGLYNIVWARNCKRVVEIYDRTFKQDSLRQVACRLGIDHLSIPYTDISDDSEDDIAGYFK